MYQYLRPLIFLLDPERAHQLTIQLLSKIIKKKMTPVVSHPQQLWGLHFPNRVGVAAGFDKNGECIDALLSLGFGFVEVGTVTPLPQEGNPKPRLYRLPKARAVINRMGFNNKGVDYLVERLKARQVPGIVGVNIGKNKETANDQAYRDYLICLKKVYAYADYIVINISSPNTPGLRDLQSEAYLTTLLQHVTVARDELRMTHRKRVPLLVKLSPDFLYQELATFIDVLLKNHIDGVIATNTTVSRDGVGDLPHAAEAGGLSGRPLSKRSTEMLREIKKNTQDRLVIIGVGGIDGIESAQEKFAAGANLIQVYTGLIYEGPALVKALCSL